MDFHCTFTSSDSDNPGGQFLSYYTSSCLDNRPFFVCHLVHSSQKWCPSNNSSLSYDYEGFFFDHSPMPAALDNLLFPLGACSREPD